MGPMAIDNSALMYLSLLRRDHANTYRFTVRLTDPVHPHVLQQAADRIFHRFPGIFAGFHPGFFSYSQVPAAAAPVVRQDDGLLRTLSKEEVRCCPYRIFHAGNEISVEIFHALTDGFGAMATIRALLGEYLYLLHGIRSPERTTVCAEDSENLGEELRDAYLDHSEETPASVPNRTACLLPNNQRNWEVKAVSRPFLTDRLLRGAKACGVSLTAFLTGIMAESIQELQFGEGKPVRIMVPIDLRKLNPSKTLRNYILYALPTLEPEQARLPRNQRMEILHRQLREQVTAEYLFPQVARNVRLQGMLLFRMLPLPVKRLLTRVSYGIYGERNSSITLTNLGNVTFSAELRPYVREMDVLLTPRRKSPYNCALISCGGETRISITRFNQHPNFEERFFRKLEEALPEEPGRGND